MDVFVQGLTGFLSRIIAVILVLLPKSPFFYLEQNSTITLYLSYFNYFVPVDFMISVGTAWLTAIGIYYVYQLILRWVKMVE